MSPTVTPPATQTPTVKLRLTSTENCYTFSSLLHHETDCDGISTVCKTLFCKPDDHKVAGLTDMAENNTFLYQQGDSNMKKKGTQDFCKVLYIKYQISQIQTCRVLLSYKSTTTGLMCIPSHCLAPSKAEPEELNSPYLPSPASPVHILGQVSPPSPRQLSPPLSSPRLALSSPLCPSERCHLCPAGSAAGHCPSS